MKIDIGISESARVDIAEGLKKVLADSYSLYLKTHNYHWNVTGPMFQTLHLMFEEQYTELATAVDVIAERIRALGVFAPGSYKQFKELSQVKDAPDVVPKAEEMIKDLVESHETVIKTARKLYPLVDEVNDESTSDLLTTRISLHEKTAWMLRSLIG